MMETAGNTTTQATIGRDGAGPSPLDEAREAIAAKGRERGFVTSDDLLESLPEDDLTPEQVEDFLARIEEHLRDEGIEIIEVDAAEPETDGDVAAARAVRNQDLLKSPSYDPVRMYLKEIGRVPLLTAAQEVDLAMRIECGEMASRLLLAIGRTGKVDGKELKRVVEACIRIREHQLNPEKRLRHEGIGKESVSRAWKPKTRRDLVDVMERVEADFSVAKSRLIESNLRLVVSIAKRYVSRGMAFLDLCQEGNLGLIRAVEKFDYRRGYKFSTYATWWIRQAITRAIADQSRVIRIPVHMTEYINKVSRAQRDLMQELGREPTAEEIGKRVSLPADRVEEILEISRDPLSLESPVGEEEDARLGDFIEDADVLAPLDAASFTMLQEQIMAVLHSLSTREQRVVQLRFGLLDGHPRTLEEVGKEFGITRERTRQIEAKTLSKLRHPSRAQRLRDYLE
jgi:RNA polymerase primary sigma factor